MQFGWLGWWVATGFLQSQAFFESADSPIALVKCGLWQLQQGAEKRKKQTLRRLTSYRSIKIFAVAEVFYLF